MVKKTIVDEKILRQAVEQALKQPRLAFYSPLAAGILNYRKSVIPRYSISDEIAKIVEAALRKKYPALTQKTKNVLRNLKESGQSPSKQPARRSVGPGAGRRHGKEEGP